MHVFQVLKFLFVNVMTTMCLFYQLERLSCLCPIRNIQKIVPNLIKGFEFLSSGFLFGFSPPFLHVQNFSLETLMRSTNFHCFLLGQKIGLQRYIDDAYSKHFLDNERTSIARSFQQRNKETVNARQRLSKANLELHSL